MTTSAFSARSRTCRERRRFSLKASFVFEAPCRYSRRCQCKGPTTDRSHFRPARDSPQCSSLAKETLAPKVRQVFFGAGQSALQKFLEENDQSSSLFLIQCAQ